MTKHLDILIIGAGISGLLAARELRLAGRDVTILDKSQPGLESSWAGGGILLPIYPWRQAPAISDLAINSLQKYPSLSCELLAATGIDPEWYDCGMLICKNPDIDDAVNWCQQRGIRYQTPPVAELMAGINTDSLHPLWLPEIAQARNPRLLKSLHAFLLQAGVKFIDHSVPGKINIANRRVLSVETADQTFTVEQLIVSAGAWTADLIKTLLPDWPVDLQIQPVRGQMLLFDAAPTTLACMVLDGDRYLIPRRDGKILAGSTVEQAGFNKITTEEAKQQLFQFAIGLLPALKDYPVSHHWAGLRPGTPQGIPYIGRHPDLDNLSINAGHFRNGLVMGPAAARLLADMILQRPTEIDPTPYLPSRAP